MHLKHFLYSCSLLCAMLLLAPTWSAEYDVADMPVTYCYPNEEVSVVTSINLLIAKYSAMLRLDSRVLRAVIAHESAFVVTAYNPSDPSYGLGQVMPKFWRYAFVAQCGAEATPETLMDAELNICYSAHILRHFIDRYGRVAGVDAYNNGTGESRGYSDTVLRYLD